MEFKESEFLVETEVYEAELIISRTDLQGNITHVNDIFSHISGYESHELIGKPHSIVRHPDMPKAIFEDLWKNLKNGQKWEGIVKNLRKDKGFYWVKAIVSEVYKDGVLIGYKSLRTPVSYTQKLKAQKLYDKMRLEHGEKIRTVIYK